MTKTTIIAIIVIVFAGLGLFLINNKSGNEMVENSGQEVSENENSTFQGKKMSFSEFLRQDKGAYECTVNQYIDAGMTQTTEGRVFLYDGNVRGDFETNVSGMNVASSVIVRDGFSYTWTNMAPIGFKAEATMVTEDVVDSNQTSGTYMWNSDQIGEYECQKWNVDKTKFELPSGVTFQEI